MLKSTLANFLSTVTKGEGKQNIKQNAQTKTLRVNVRKNQTTFEIRGKP